MGTQTIRTCDLTGKTVKPGDDYYKFQVTKTLEKGRIQRADGIMLHEAFRTHFLDMGFQPNWKTLRLDDATKKWVKEDQRVVA